MPRGTVSPLGSLAGTPAAPAYSPMALSPLGGMGMGISGSGAMTPQSTAAPATVSLLPARANPHRLFIREPPPGTESVMAGSSAAPSSTIGGTGAGAGGAVPPSPGPTPGQEERGASATPLSPRGQANGAAGGGADGVHDSAGGAVRTLRPLDSISRGFMPVGAASRRVAQNGGESPAPALPSPQPSSRAPLPQLGRLASEGYHYEPGPTQLDAMYQTDPASLAKVCVLYCYV